MQLLIPGNTESYIRKKYYYRTFQGLIRNNLSTIKKKTKTKT